MFMLTPAEPGYKADFEEPACGRSGLYRGLQALMRPWPAMYQRSLCSRNLFLHMQQQSLAGVFNKVQHVIKTVRPAMIGVRHHRGVVR